MTTPPLDPAPGAPNERPSAHPSPRPATRPPLTDEAKARFAARLESTKTAGAAQLALAIAKRIGDDGTVLCPKCSKVAPKGKFKIHPDGGWKHFSSDGCFGDPVKILQLAGISTGDAVKVLLGEQPSVAIEVPENAAALAEAFVGTRSKIDIDVFNGVMVYGQKTGGVEAAQEFYGTWHIDPAVVADSGAVYIKDTKKFAELILDRFGEDRLVESGLFVRTERGVFCLVNDRFPIVEPHRHPATGDVLYMQFRASHAQYQRYLDHKAGKREYKGSEKIVSLKGAPPAAQVGTGLYQLDKLPAGSEIYIVEGFKDQLAARTLGYNAYGLPGVGVAPPDRICALLARHTVYVAFDGDEAGQQGANGITEKQSDGTEKVVKKGLVTYLREHGVNAEAKVLFAGMDVTDILVSRHASGKATGTRCSCTTCVNFRTKNPQWFPNG